MSDAHENGRTKMCNNRLKHDSHVKEMIRELESQVYEGYLTSGQAADQVLSSFISRQREVHKADVQSIP